MTQPVPRHSGVHKSAESEPQTRVMLLPTSSGACPDFDTIGRPWPDGQMAINGHFGHIWPFMVDSGTVSLFALTSDLTNSETVAATL